MTEEKKVAPPKGNGVPAEEKGSKENDKTDKVTLKLLDWFEGTDWEIVKSWTNMDNTFYGCVQYQYKDTPSSLRLAFVRCFEVCGDMQISIDKEVKVGDLGLEL